ncbi:MAG TPA: GH92 family glycosyl hydrolase [Kofleriaceae bacterium]|nr:GH92 family glycosyl hydrolase [Kofleriaceae bacterium]
MLRVALLVVAVACGDDLAAPPLPPVSDPIPYADPFIGSGGFGYAAGSAFPGAAAPSGLAKVGPDTDGPFGTITFLHYSGYWFGDDTIQGFSHVHLHGTGLPDYGVLSLMPVDGPVDAGRTTAAGYESTFAKESERASPGYYDVTLDRGGIQVEITATPHAAHHRIRFADGEPGNLVVDLAKHLPGGTVDSAEIELWPDEQRMAGRLRSIGDMSDSFGGYDLYFDAVTRQPWTSSVVWSDETGAPAAGTAASGTGVGCGLAFAPSAAPVEVQVGLSFVSAAAARANREAEMPGWDFEATRAAVEGEWRQLLGRVRVEGGSEAERRMFYSALYRAFLMPTVASDVDGGYRFGAGEPAVASGFRFMTDMSLWDTYRTLHPLYDLVAPEVAADAVGSLVAMAGALGFFPKWPIATGESGVMLGASAEIVVADAVVKGIEVDAAGAYAVLRAAALDAEAPAAGRGGRGDIDEYLALGYVPASRDRSASTTVEYAWDDRALSEVAAALGEEEDAALLAERSRGWRQLYDPSLGFVRARNADGSWPSASDFDPTEFTDEFAEANAWQTVFSAFHDPEGMIELFGGPEAFTARLEELFAAAEADLAARPRDDTIASSLPRPFYWHGNEPDIHAAYLFALAGRPELTARWVDWIRASLYTDGPNGLAGNDDGGTLSAWYVWSALGLYPIAGTDVYVLGAPIFSRAWVELPGGALVVEAAPAGEREGRVLLDGEPVEGGVLRHADLLGGRTLRFE